MNIEEMKTTIKNGNMDKDLSLLYTDVDSAKQRYTAACDEFIKIFGSQDEVSLFSAPGRTEVGGNHTDHQRGCVLAAAVDLDIIAAASKNDENIIRIKSAGFENMIIVDLSNLKPQKIEAETTAALIRGVCAYFTNNGYHSGGFDAYATSDVLKGSGLSSSAAFEVLIGTILNHFYNEGGVDPVTIAKAGQFSENNYFGKPSGLMDQTASSVGGFVGIDFSDTNNPVIEKVDFDFMKAGYALCIIDTGGDHADLTNEYASITHEMRNIASYFGKTVLSEVAKDEFYKKIGDLRKFGDRAVLRAAHYFADTKRAVEEKFALKRGDFNEFLRLVTQSGQSSFMFLQNLYVAGVPGAQGLPLALCLSTKILDGQGACRVHGGGFGGTIQAFVPVGLLEKYIKEMQAVFGENSCYSLNIRAAGGVKVR